MAELKELESLWVVTEGAHECARLWIRVCVNYAERETERRLWALHGIALTKH